MPSECGIITNYNKFGGKLMTTNFLQITPLSLSFSFPQIPSILNECNCACQKNLNYQKSYPKQPNSREVWNACG